jgi:hypothetical protein
MVRIVVVHKNLVAPHGRRSGEDEVIKGKRDELFADVDSTGDDHQFGFVETSDGQLGNRTMIQF